MICSLARSAVQWGRPPRRSEPERRGEAGSVRLCVTADPHRPFVPPPCSVVCSSRTCLIRNRRVCYLSPTRQRGWESLPLAARRAQKRASFKKDQGDEG